MKQACAPMLGIKTWSSTQIVNFHEEVTH